MVGSIPPSVLKRWIAFELRGLRLAHGYEREQVAARLDKTVGQVGHVETMRNLPSASDLEVLLTWYGHADRVPFFRDLLRQAKKGRDWWVGLDQHTPKWFSPFLGLESAAVRIESYDAVVVPGLFQTYDYARAIFEAQEPSIPDDEVEARLELRMARQRVRDDAARPAPVWAVLDESVLHREIGGRAVLRAQLVDLLARAEQEHIRVQLMPFAVGAHAGIEGTCTVLEFPPELIDDHGVAYAETRTRGVYAVEADEIALYREVLRRLRDRALDPDETREVITRRVEELA